MGDTTGSDLGDGTRRITIDDSPDSQTEVSVAGSGIETTSTAEAAPAAADDGSPTDNKSVDATEETASPTEEGLSIQQDDAAQSVLEAAGLSLDTFASEYAETGALSDESMAVLVEKAGIPREVVEGYITGQEALAKQTVEAITSKAFEIAGSAEAYSSLTAWAGENLNAAEQDAFNKEVNSLSPERTEQAIRGLVQRHQASEGFEGNTISGSPISSTSADIYADKSGMLTDLADVRYQTSPAFRATVDAKVARSMQNHGGSLPSN